MAEMSDLIERLRREYDPMNMRRFGLVNPDGPEAAEEIIRLTADNERLREALKPFAEIAGWYDDAEDDDFPIWSDYPHGWIKLDLSKLKHYRNARQALGTP